MFYKIWFSVTFLITLLFIVPLSAQRAVKLDRVATLQQPVDFTVTEQGIIYVIEGSTSEIIKFSPEGTIQKQSGGFGWDAGLFDAPVALFNNIISVFVTDKNNHRVQQFDKDLNYIGSLLTTPTDQTNATEIRYPIDCLVAPQGDYFILDSENKRIVKFDPFGKFQLDFGGINWGSFALQSPRRFVPGSSEYIGVLEANKVVLYSLFGTGLRFIPVPDSVSSAYLVNNLLYCAGNKKVTVINFEDATAAPDIRELPVENDVLKIEYKNNSLYILTTTAIYRSIF
jgi:hypothetical protein